MLGAGSEEPLVDELIEDAVGMAAEGSGDVGDGMEDDFGEPDDVRTRLRTVGSHSVPHRAGSMLTCHKMAGEVASANLTHPPV